jgi:hypothetical protein
MAKIKVRFSINKGRHGAPMAKLGRISEQAEKFLRSLASDCDIATRPGEWLAANFKNGSVEYDAEFQDDVNSGSVQVFSKHLEALADYDPDGDGFNLAVTPNTALEYSRIGALIDPDEIIGIGIYPTRGGRPRWRQITYSATSAIRRQIEAPIPSYGSAQGILHAWFKEAREPNFQLRELSTDALIRVHYPASLYREVAEAVKERTTMLIVSGNMMFDRATRQATELRAERIQKARMLSTAEFEEFFGSAPDFTSGIDEDEETYVDG